MTHKATIIAPDITTCRQSAYCTFSTVWGENNPVVIHVIIEFQVKNFSLTDNEDFEISPQTLYRLTPYIPALNDVALRRGW